MSRLSAEITCRIFVWASSKMFRSKIGLITIIAPFRRSPLMSDCLLNDPRPRCLIFRYPLRIVPTGSVFIWNAPAPPVVPLVVAPPVAEPYDLAYLYPRSYDNAIRYNSSGVFVDRHSSFCASLFYSCSQWIHPAKLWSPTLQNFIGRPVRLKLSRTVPRILQCVVFVPIIGMFHRFHSFFSKLRFYGI